jgi:hypothetical protein
VSRSVTRREAANQYLGALFGSAAESSLIEVRFRVGSGMRQRFFAADRLEPVVAEVLALASHTDVFVGVLPRGRRRGRREDVVKQSGVVWADCDTPTSSTALASFRPRPSMAVASGSGRHRHAYWLLRDPVDLDTLELLNRRLALALGADAGVVTKAQTILRPPGTVNMKHSPPALVRLIGLLESRRVSMDELDRVLPQEEVRIEPSRPARRPWRIAVGEPPASDEPWKHMEPADYYRVITGLEPMRDGRIRCPSVNHEDRHPSAKLYSGEEAGWYCFSCGAGGRAPDLVAALRGWPTGRALRDEMFKECIVELQRIFKVAARTEQRAIRNG